MEGVEALFRFTVEAVEGVEALFRFTVEVVEGRGGAVSVRRGGPWRAWRMWPAPAGATCETAAVAEAC
jgi:hypothetical protein